MNGSRRDFLRYGSIAGGAFALRVPLSAAASDKAAPTRFAPNQWIRVTSDGRATLVVARSEMGQGVRTALAMILAEELEADWEKIAVEQASPSSEYEDMSTGGSDSVISSWTALRRAAAAAREMLVEAAAREWKVDRAACRAEKGSVFHGASGRRLSYGSLVAAASKLSVPKEPALKDPKNFRLVGTRVRRIDGPEIVSGRAKYGLDAAAPGILRAAVARCPVSGGRLVRFDAAKAKRIPGVRDVVAIGTGVAVLADDTWAAFAGRDALEVTWDEGKNASLDTAELRRRLDAGAGQPGHVSRKEGDAGAALAAAAKTMRATYRDPFQAHATVETGNAVARVASGRCEIWAPTQNPQRVQRESAKILGLPLEKVTVHVTLLGGAFGRRLGADEATEAVEVARAAGGRPVQVVRSRPDDFREDRLHPAGRVDIEAGLDAAGRIVAWKQRYTSFHLSMFGAFDPNAVDSPDVNPWGGYDNPYAIANLQAEWLDVESPIPTGAWRAVFYPPNVFARECFFDEIAHATGRDPLDLRRELLTGDFAFASRRVDRSTIRAVLDLAAAKGGWGSSLPAIPGRRSGRGIACNVYHGRTAVAQVAEVSVGDRGDVRVHRVVCAVDCGQVVNPLGLEGQVESGIAWGLSYALKGDVTIAKGRVEQGSFRDYPVLSMAEMPSVEVHSVPSSRPPSGFGEMPVPPVAPAVANAVFAATGRRLRSLPIRPADLATA
jgi:isoquinoline 1-oxidoreductase beta subunit